jgi:uncharacterized protein (DUF488 family)
MRAADRQLLTVGHGPLDEGGLGSLLRNAGVRLLVDIRRFPGSRGRPQLGEPALADWLPAQGIEYRWDSRLGGRRRLPADAPVIDTWWTVEAFRAYAAHTRTPEFRAGMAELLDATSRPGTAVMCSESVWWRCHRRLVADVAALVHGVQVRHLMPDGKLRPHAPAAGARLTDGALVWDVTDVT